MSEAKAKILHFLGAGRRAITAVSMAGGAIFALAAIVLFGLSVVILNGLFFMESSARSALFFLWLAISIAAAIRWVIWPIVDRPALRTVAIGLEKTYPKLKSRLVSAFDLLHVDPQRLGYSPELIEAVVVDAGKRVEKLDPHRLAPLSSLRERSAYLGLAIILAFGLSAIFPSTFRTGLNRGFRPFADFPRPTLTSLDVSPGDAQITKYDDLEIAIEASGKLPERVSIFRQFAGEHDEREYRAERDKDDPHKWSFLFEDVKRDFVYRVEGGDYVGGTFAVRVVDRPRVIDMILTLNYPDYTGLPTQKLEENEGAIDVPYGTYVTIGTKFSKEIAEGSIVFSDSSGKKLAVDGRYTKVGFRAVKNRTYHLEVVDREGLSNDEPIEYPVRVRMDEYPSVEITSPATDVQLSEQLTIPLSIVAEDDYGFSRFQIAHILHDSPNDTVRTKIPSQTGALRQVALDYIWDLNPIGLAPEDVVLYWVEAFDNDAVTGPKMAVSKVYAARFPSIEEIFEEISNEREQQVVDVEEVSRRQRDLSKEINDITREMQNESEVSYEKREEIREALQKQNELIQKLQKSAEEYQKTTEKVIEQQTAASEIIDKMMEIQKLLEEVATDEMREAMRKLQEALQSMDPEELKRAAEEFKLSQEELMERLDRTLSLLKRMQIEQRIEDMKNLAKKLEEMQDKISEGLKNGDMSQKDAQKMQDRITQGSDLLEKGTEELAKMMSEFDDMPSDAAKQLSDEMKKNSPSGKSKQCKASMQSGSMSQCQSQSKELSEQFDQTAQQLEQMQKQMQTQISAETMAAIRKAVFSLLDLSSRQESLNDQLAANPRSFSIARGLTEKGANIRAGLMRVTVDVMNIANKNFMIPPSIGALLGNANRQVEGLLADLEQGRGYSAHPKGQEAMASMNVAAEKLLETMDKMSNSSSCSGSQSFFQQMQSMCDKQGQINAATLPIAQGQQMQPGGMSPDQQAAAARLAAEQEGVRKSLQQLAKEAAERSDIAGRMDDIIDEMQDVVEDLRNNNADERTLQHQERILSRMLDVQKSLHNQGYKNKRKSRTGKDIARKSPDKLPEDLGERRDLLQQQLLRALNQPYPKEYETLIKEYFKTLREDNTPVKSENEK
ncbi:hypothetical protein J7L01_03115 [bacterium]|nr:hypothetical protein [bacterium]